ncbi:hypothetical protein CTV95_13675 [Pectobacterium brasiliense]|nr:hypothetical protein CTV95_13675 [Pectobacterium brasiliense]MBA0210489.1 hypothetical protein [Pectobacterium brasiliense]MCH4991940.1 hypothetical protein [Pectobacterium brasiliense]
MWRKLHLAVDANTHEIVCADLSLSNVTDALAMYPERNQAVAHQRLTGNNKLWKEKMGYQLRSVA